MVYGAQLNVLSKFDYDHSGIPKDVQLQVGVEAHQNFQVPAVRAPLYPLYPLDSRYDRDHPPKVDVSLQASRTLLHMDDPLYYYHNLRVHTNLPGFLRPTTIPGFNPIPAPCPAIINPRCTAGNNCAIRIPPMILDPLARTVIQQQGRVCSAHSSFVYCLPTAATWTMATCPWASAGFVARPYGSNLGVLGGTGLESVAFSSDINCPGGYVNAGYDASGLLLDWYGEPLSSFDGVPASLLVPYGNNVDDTGFAVSCLQVTYTTLDYSSPVPIIDFETEDGVDWSLILDLDAPDSPGWVGALIEYIGSSGDNLAYNLALQGLYDLGGQNDCDFGGTASLPECADGRDNAPPFWPPDGYDTSDPQCFSVDSRGVPYYNPANSE
jgi:hypothetical protein